MALAITSPLPQFFDLDGDPLQGGRLYFGEAGQNPETDPITVYWDEAATQPAAQPVSTVNGYIVRGSSTSGTPTLIYATAAFSLTVRDRRGQLVLYVPDSSNISNDQTLLDLINALRADLANTSDATKGAGLPGFNDSLVYPQGSAGIALRGRVNVKAHPYNAVGDGAADDTAALIAAEAVAYTSGRSLFFPGGTYCFDGTFTTRVSIEGSGATIKQTQSAVSLNNTLGAVAAGADGIVISGLTVDGGLKTSGFTSDGRSYITYRECVASNCVNIGFGNFNGSRIDVWSCRATGIRYNATGVAGRAADGFYFGGCTRSRWIGCGADDFRRIGFVSESNGATKSAQIQALFCLASNANNCDDSTTEYNSGFWAENTNSIDWLYCTASDIATGVGQTSGRVTGFWALGAGNNSRGSVSVVGCRVFGGTNYLPSAMMISGSSTYADVLVQDCYLNRARTGISTGCGLNSLTIRNLTIEDIVNTNGSQGGILIDNGGTAALPVLEIDKVNVTGATWNADAGLVNFFQGVSGCKYTLRNVKGAVPHVMRGNVARIRTEECEIACGAATYSSFLASVIEHVDPVFTSRNSANTDLITSAGSLASGSRVVFRGGTVTGFGAGWAPDFTGVSVSVTCHGTTFDNFCWDINTTGTFDDEFYSCRFLNVPASIGSIRTNANAPTKQILHILGGGAVSNNVADTPFRKRGGGSDPTRVVIQGVRYNATVIHDYGVATSVVNNAAV
jgi:hypothetical protein